MTTQNLTVIGLQWGDEGKGKVIDHVAPLARYVVRYAGGANAGHTVVAEGQKYAMHLIPCGILRKGLVNVVGNGLAFDPSVAKEEIEALRSRGVSIGPENLRISSCAHAVMPWHKLEDRLSEESLGAGKIGTTARGIGPCYADKALRTTAIRMGEFADADHLAGRVRQVAAHKNKLLGALYGAEPMDIDKLVAEAVQLGRWFAPMICNTGAVLRKAIQRGDRILFEGAQGSMLDVDHGTYPFATSSSVTACGVPSGAGVPPASVGTIIGLVKAYTTRVGAGPFPTELDNEIGQTIRDRGHEYGTTTGRPRRCGWLDLFLVRHTAELSGVHEVALGLLDVLGGLDELKICTGYKVNGRVAESFDPALLADTEPVYETLPGWKQDISACRRFEDLPAEARQYVTRVEQVLGRPVGFIGVGPDREQTIIHNTTVSEIRG